MAPSGDFCVLGCCLAGSVLAGSDFDEVFLRRDKGGATPDVFVWQDAVTPGMKLVDIRVNDNWRNTPKCISWITENSGWPRA